MVASWDLVSKEIPKRHGAVLAMVEGNVTQNRQTWVVTLEGTMETVLSLSEGIWSASVLEKKIALTWVCSRASVHCVHAG